MTTKTFYACEMCKHFDAGSGCGKDCGSPMVGKGFPEYEGVLGSNLYKFCFVCGAPSQYMSRTLGKQGELVSEFRPIGVCKGHLRVMNQYSPTATKSAEIKGEKFDLKE